MIDALVSGKLHGVPNRRTSKNGSAFTVAKVRVPTGEESVFCNVICFAEHAQAALLALGDGEAVALAGTLKVGTWQAKDGTTKPSLDLTAAQVLTAYHVTKKRKAMQPEQDGEQRSGQRPSHAAWEAAAPAKRQPYRRDDFGADPGELDNGAPLDF